MKIKILTDSSVALPQSLIEKNNIGIIPIKVSWEEEGIDGIIKGAELFEKMKQSISKIGPKTSQPSIGDFKKEFDIALKDNDFIIYLAIGTGTSGSYNSAIQAKKFLNREDQDRVFVIDSCNLDGTLALLCLKAKELSSRDIGIKEVVEKLEKFKNDLHLFGFVDSVDWLEKSGRLTSIGANIARQAQKIGIRPLIGLKKGKVSALGLKFKAKDKKEAILRELKEVVGDKKAYLVITHANCIEDANFLKEKINKDFLNIEILFTEEINPIIGAHAGPGTVLFSFFLEDNNI